MPNAGPRTEKTAGVKRPNCFWVAVFEVLTGGKKYRVDFAVSRSQKDAYLADGHDSSVDRNYSHLICAKLRDEHGVIVEILAPSQFRLIEFHSRDAGSMSTEELARIMRRTEKNTAETAAIVAAHNDKKAAKEKAKRQRITRTGDGQAELF